MMKALPTGELATVATQELQSPRIHHKSSLMTMAKRRSERTQLEAVAKARPRVDDRTRPVEAEVVIASIIRALQL